MTEHLQVLAFDIGGSHATAGIVDVASLGVHSLHWRAIDSNGTAPSILDALHMLGSAVLAEAQSPVTTLAGIALAVPGPFDYEHGISLLQHKYASLYRVDVRRELETRFKVDAERITFLNDAQAFLLGECHGGAGKGLRQCIGLTLGTGVGSAFATDGNIVEHGPGVPPGGEIYSLAWDGATVEDSISTRAIQGRYHRLTGLNASVKDICLSALNNRAAQQVMHEFGADLGAVLKSLCLEFHPEAIILGGAIARSANLFIPDAARVLDIGSDRILRVSQLWDQASLLGAAWRYARILNMM